MTSFLPVRYPAGLPPGRPYCRRKERLLRWHRARPDDAGLPKGEIDMRSTSLSFGLPARLAFLALTIVAAVALAGFPGLGGHSNVATAAGGVTPTYYVAADGVPWGYAPSGMNKITGPPLGPVEDGFMPNRAKPIWPVYSQA